jgi:hypothetical protein
MENQVRQLKLNVTNIKSYLFNSNKELRKLQVKKNNLFSKLQKQEEFRKEEKRIETKNVKSGLGRIAGVVVAPARSFFDRMLDFFGLIALGILANNLPKIIKGITDIAQRIENFFNSDFMKNLTSILETVGTAFTNLGRFIGLLPEDKQNEYEKALRDEIDKKLDEDLNTNMDTSEMELEELEKLLEDLGGDVEKLNKDLDQDKNPDKSQNQWWDFLDVFPNQQPEATVPEPQQSLASPEPPSQQQTSPEPTPEPDKPKPPQRLSRGGTVRSDGENQESTQVYQPRKSGKLKRAQRSANEGFTGFPLAVDSINDAIEKDEENMMAFVEMSKKFRELSILKEKDKKDKKLTSPGSPDSDPNDLDDLRGASRGYSAGNIPIDPGKKIVGYVGSTGRSSGPHIHIETGNGYGGAGGNIPAEVLNNIIVDGKPLSQHPMGDELGAGRGHRGFDYPIRKGAPIQLQGGLKFVDFDEVSDPGGYGKSIVITDKNGNTYLIGHLSAGPEDPKEFEKRREKARKKQQPKNEPIVQPIPKDAGFTLEPVSPDGVEVKPAEKNIVGTAYIIFGKLYYLDESGGGTLRNSDGKVINPESLPKNFLQELNIQRKLRKKQPTPKLRGKQAYISPKDLSLKNNQLIASASGAPQSLFVYAIQPQETFVPFPYPMPIPQESEAPSPETPKLPPIWRSIA